MPNIDFGVLFIAFVVLLLSLTVHEAAHAWTASWLGDPTARLLGRVSLNPAVHVDPIGTILFPLIAMVYHVPLLGWAKPVPVNTQQLRPHWKQKYMLIAAAGPASNLVLAVLASIVMKVAFLGNAGGDGEGFQAMLPFIMGLVIRLNVLLAVFNMIPVPPLDGGNVLAGLLHGRAAEAFDGLRQYGFIILYGLMLTGVLWRIVSPPESLILSWLL